MLKFKSTFRVLYYDSTFMTSKARVQALLLFLGYRWFPQHLNRQKFYQDFNNFHVMNGVFSGHISLTNFRALPFCSK